MVKRTQTIRRLLPTNCLSVFDHFVKLTLKGLIGLDVDIDTNMQNIAYLGKIMSICNKQHLTNIWGSIH